ncbi:MAG: glycosyl hydrolase 53 family protein [Eubacteriales bacterium]|nr:glycosyl hydrolase 53 family protein [Eubacteriales bacterium]
MSDWIKGMDLSTLMEVERCGGKFYDRGVCSDAMDILKEYGMNMVRLRLWNDPFTEDGKSYGAGGNDIETTLSIAKRAKEKGVGWLLDFHYSDFWADPGKQRVPKAWRKMDAAQLESAVYDYTFETLRRCRSEDILPQMVAVGNEISKGLLWPYGKVPQFDNIARFVSAGIRAVRKIDKNIKIMIHLDNGGNNELYRTWFDSYFTNGGEDFDCIGLSYYPFWHGTLNMLKHNMNDIALRYHKDLVVAEVSMGYTMEDYREYEQLEQNDRKGMATRPELVEKIDYPMTTQGQSDFMRDILEVIRDVPEGRGKGFFYWEPAWIPVPGSGWATSDACEYIGEAGPGGNEWANQALFDYRGNVLPALKVIRDFL